MNITFNAIVAATENGIMGIQNKLPWDHLKSDMSLFKNKTINKTIIMGRKTWDSLNHQPLPKRNNIIISRHYSRELLLQNKPLNTYVCTYIDVDKLSHFIQARSSVFQYSYNECWVIGGAEIFKTLLPFFNQIYYTQVYDHIEQTEQHITIPTLQDLCNLNYNITHEQKLCSRCSSFILTNKQ